MNIHRWLCTCILALCASQLANATGGAVNLTLDQLFKEHDFSAAVTLKKDGTTEDTGPTALGIISAGSGNERKIQFCELGKKGISIIGKGTGETDVRLLRVEHLDQAALQELEVLLTEKGRL